MLITLFLRANTKRRHTQTIQKKALRTGPDAAVGETSRAHAPHSRHTCAIAHSRGSYYYATTKSAATAGRAQQKRTNSGSSRGRADRARTARKESRAKWTCVSVVNNNNNGGDAVSGYVPGCSLEVAQRWYWLVCRSYHLTGADPT